MERKPCRLTKKEFQQRLETATAEVIWGHPFILKYQNGLSEEPGCRVEFECVEIVGG